MWALVRKESVWLEEQEQTGVVVDVKELFEEVIGTELFDDTYVHGFV